MATDSETAESPVGLDLSRLQGYFRENVPGLQGSLRASLIAGGKSNLTYRVTDGSSEWVVRRPPLGLVTPTAHDMGRECRVMAGVGAAGVPVPEVVAFCDDESVIGAQFSVLSYVDGDVIRDGASAAALPAEDATAIGEGMVRELAHLHQVDYEAVGLGDLGKPDGYLERQVRRWYGQWERVQTRELPALEDLHQQLSTKIPAQAGKSVVHGDYRIDNLILDREHPGKIAAIVDWEMATLGDPLADLGLTLVYWDPRVAPILGEQHVPSSNPGFPSGDGFAEAYARVSGLDVSRLDFYVALASFKLAVIAEGIHARFLGGKTVGEGFESVGRAVEPLVVTALDQLRQ